MIHLSPVSVLSGSCSSVVVDPCKYCNDTYTQTRRERNLCLTFSNTHTDTHLSNLLLSPMVLYNAVTVVYLYERSLHRVLFFLFWFILCDFFVVVVIITSKAGRPVYSLSHLCSALLLPLISVGAFSSLITWHQLMLSQLPQKEEIQSIKKICRQATVLQVGSRRVLSFLSSAPCFLSFLFSAGESVKRCFGTCNELRYYSLTLVDGD